MLGQLLAVGAGAVLGAWIRWGLGLALNSSHFPHGTLAANLLGGLLMGVALAVFVSMPATHGLRLFVMTGFLGALTTFSTFSAEAFSFLHKQQYWIALTHMAGHLFGSILMTAIGFWLAHQLRS